MHVYILEKYVMLILNIFIYKLNYIIIDTHVNIFYIYGMCVYLHIHIHSTHTYIM